MQWVSLFIDKYTAPYFHSFGIEYIPQEVSKIKRKSMIRNTFRIQFDNPMMCRFYLLLL